MGALPIFYLHSMHEGVQVSSKLEQLQALLAPVVEGLGYQCWGIEFVSQGKHSVLRIYIDKPPESETGIDVEDCATASHVISDLLDADDPFPGRYSLEVSSPGTDRVLRTPEHFARFVDNRVKVELLAPRDGRKRYTGMLRRVADGSIEMEVDNFSVSIRLAEISRARSAPL